LTFIAFLLAHDLLFAIRYFLLKISSYLCAQIKDIGNKSIHIMETFKDVISGDRLVLVDFFATWCGPCKAMHPVLENLKDQLGDRLRIIKVDVDKYGQTAMEYGIQSVPTLMLFRNGQQLWRQSGALPLQQLLAVVNPFLS